MTYAQENKTIETTIIDMEKAALERWNHGDPSGFLEISASDVVYFDPFVEKRLTGIAELTALYESLKGKVHSDSFLLIDPQVQAADRMAVLTFNYVSHSGTEVYKWNCTEVYRLEPDGKWRIIQTHWSPTQPAQK
jgi:ketosteroid isomerase-like protein